MRAGQRNLGVVVAIQTGNIAIVRARDGFLRLHDLYRIGDARAESVASLRQRLLREVDIAPRHGDLFLAGLDVQQRGANIRVNLGAQVFQPLAALF